MDEFPSNSLGNSKDKGRPKAAPADKKIEQIVTGNVVRRKKSLGKRVKAMLVGDEETGGVGQFVLTSVLIPAAKDMLADATSSYIERMLYGEVRGGSARRRSSSGMGYSSPIRTNYGGQFSSGGGRRDTPQQPTRSRVSYQIDDIILESRAEAASVIERMDELISEFGSASVADLYEFLGVSGEFTDNKWGWTDIRGSQPTRVRDGYMIDLPRPEPLK